MALFDARCESCGNVDERRGAFVEVDDSYCECGGHVKVFFAQVNLSMDATPTRGYGRTSTHPGLVRKDGTAVNPGHEPVTGADLNLSKDQERRLGLRKDVLQ